MSKILRSLAWIAAAALICAGPANAAGDAAAGATKASTCMGCHGIKTYNNVYPTYHVPMLGGQSETYIASALKEYRNGERSHKTMHAQAASLSDQDIDDIAAFISHAPRHQ
jgi:cytochrome c553